MPQVCVKLELFACVEFEFVREDLIQVGSDNEGAKAGITTWLQWLQSKRCFIVPGCATFHQGKEKKCLNTFFFWRCGEKQTFYSFCMKELSASLTHLSGKPGSHDGI